MSGGNNWLDDISKAWPMVASLGALLAYFIGLFARTHANDREIIALTKTVETLVNTISQMAGKQTTQQASIEYADRRSNDICADIDALGKRADKNGSNIDYILGRLDFGTRQRRKGEAES